MLQTVAHGGVQQPACPTVDAATMLMACNWTSTYALAIPTTWTDGVYLAVLSSAQGFQNYVPFVCATTHARRACSIAAGQHLPGVQQLGGKSLYTFQLQRWYTRVQGGLRPAL